MRVAYVKEGKVEELQSEGSTEDLDWSSSVIVYGIVGILNLFTGISITV